jgi:hypothetical protein
MNEDLLDIHETTIYSIQVLHAPKASTPALLFDLSNGISYLLFLPV